MKSGNLIKIYKYSTDNCVQVFIPYSALTNIGEPRSVVFSEDSKSFRTSLLNTNKDYRVSYRGNGGTVSLSLIDDKDKWLGFWNYEINDLTITLTLKQK